MTAAILTIWDNLDDLSREQKWDTLRANVLDVIPEEEEWGIISPMICCLAPGLTRAGNLMKRMKYCGRR
jgi:hypothetical protein